MWNKNDSSNPDKTINKKINILNTTKHQAKGSNWRKILSLLILKIKIPIINTKEKIKE